MIKLTPPMGWNSWNTFGENINEKMIFETADVMAESGLRDKGYEYLVIDDCWSLRERDENGRLVPDPYMVNNSSSRKRYASPKAGTELYLDLVFRQ